jgi:hypothetical protein
VVIISEVPIVLVIATVVIMLLIDSVVMLLFIRFVVNQLVIEVVNRLDIEEISLVLEVVNLLTKPVGPVKLFVVVWITVVTLLSSQLSP